MRNFKIGISEDEFYTSHSGLGLVGKALNKFAQVGQHFRTIAVQSKIVTTDLIRAYVGNLTLGKNHFDSIDEQRGDDWFTHALGMDQLPSAATVRQRFDENAEKLILAADSALVDFLHNKSIQFEPLASGHIPLDIDVFPMDNSNTKKEGVSYTYKGYDGYSPVAGYLGQQGYCVGIELREGHRHSNHEFGYFLERVLPRIHTLTTGQKVLVRLDGGFDAKANMLQLIEAQVDYLIRWNPRVFNAEQCWQDKWDQIQRGDQAALGTCMSQPRIGKQTLLFSERVSIGTDAQGLPIHSRRVMCLTRRTIDHKGQKMLLPEIQAEGWFCSLTAELHPDHQIIDWYRDHATSEQFHSEFKTDLELCAALEGESLLDFGGGEGAFLRLLEARGHGRVHSVLFEPFMDVDMPQGFKVARTWEEVAALADDKLFDIVVCQEVLEHFSPEKQALALKRIASVLSKTGYLVLSVPVELGPVALVKNVGRWKYRKNGAEIYSYANLIKSFFGQPIVDARRGDGYLTHMGFYYTDFRVVLEQHFTVERLLGSPFAYLPLIFNSQVFYLCRKI